MNIPIAENIKISEIKTDSTNPNRMTDRELAALKLNIQKYGFLLPIICNKDLVIADGEHRLMAAKELGMESVPVIRLKVNEVDRKLLRQVLNKLRGQHELEKDREEFRELLQSMRAEDIIRQLPSEDQFIYKLIGKEKQVDDFDVNQALERPPKYNIKPGDLWILGKHKLLCGDSTNKDHVSKLMGGAHAMLCLTDPPYGVGYKSRKEKVSKKLASCQDLVDAQRLLHGFMSILPSATLVMTYADNKLHEYVRAADQLGIETIDLLIWKKHHFTFWMGARYQQKHELVFIARKKGAKIITNTDSKQTTIIEIPRPAKNNLHPTEKPLELWDLLMNNHSNPGDLIYDPFLGSGTTLISAERLGRTCYGIEISPHFCSAIIERFEKLTGQKAKQV